jgi:hypothetical protein
MTTNNHTAIATGAAANAATFENPLSQLDAAIGASVSTLTTTAKNVVGAVNEVDAQVDAEHNANGTHKTGIISDTYLATDVKMGSLAALTTTAKTSMQAAVNELVTKLSGTNRPNLMWDPFNEYATPTIADGGVVRWLSYPNLSIISPDAGNPFTGKTLRMGTGAAINGRQVFLSECGLRPTEVVQFSVLLKAASGSGATYQRQAQADGTGVQLTNGTTTAFTNVLQILTFSFTILATTTQIGLGIQRMTGTADIDIYAMWLEKGTVASANPSPSAVMPLKWSQLAAVKSEVETARGTSGTLNARLNAIETAFQPCLDNYGRHYLRSWQAKLAKVQNAVADSHAVISIIGDSWVNGLITPIVTRLQTTYGDSGPGFLQFGNYSAILVSGGSFTRAGTWTDDTKTINSLGPHCAHATSTDTATPASYTVVGIINSFIIHYIKKLNGGSFRYRVDTGGWTSVDTSNGSTVYATEVITGLASSSHTLIIEVTVAGTAGVTLTGVDCREDTVGVRLHFLGNAGALSLSFSQLNSTIWSDGMAALESDLVVILLGTNDKDTNVTPATFATNINTIIDRIQTLNPLCDILLLTPADNNIAGNTYTVADYVAQERAIAVSQNTACMDIYMNFGPFSDGNARGLYLNSNHPNENGYVLIKNLLIKNFLDVI